MNAVTDAGIPVLGAWARGGAAELTDPLGFPLSGGSTTTAAALGVALQEVGAETVLLALSDSPNARNFPELVAERLAGGESDLLRSVFLPLDASADISSYAAQVVEADPDGVAMVHTPDGTVRMIAALRDAGYEGEIAVAGFSLGEVEVENLGDHGDGVLVVSNWAAPTSESNEAIDRFNEDMDTYAPDAERSEFAIASWVSMHTIADALAQASTIDAAGVAEALQGLEVTEATVPPFTLGEQGLTLVSDPRVPRDTVQLQVIEDGVVVPLTNNEFFHVDTGETTTL